MSGYFEALLDATQFTPEGSRCTTPLLPSPSTAITSAATLKHSSKRCNDFTTVFKARDPASPSLGRRSRSFDW